MSEVRSHTFLRRRFSKGGICQLIFIIRSAYQHHGALTSFKITLIMRTCVSYLEFLQTLQVPVVAVLGSGGGYRAAVAFTAAIKALEDMQLLDCTTYLAGLSGSAW